MNCPQLYKQARIAKGLSQGELAARLGYPNGQYVSNWERGMCGLPIGKLKKIARILKLNMGDIVECEIERFRKNLERKCGI